MAARTDIRFISQFCIQPVVSGQRTPKQQNKQQANHINNKMKLYQSVSRGFSQNIGARVTGSQPLASIAPSHVGATPSKGSRQGLLTKNDVLSAPSTPLFSPSYPAGPYCFTDREYFIVSYESDYDKIASVVPAPLKPKSNVVMYEWINMDSTGWYCNCNSCLSRPSSNISIHS